MTKRSKDSKKILLTVICVALAGLLTAMTITALVVTRRTDDKPQGKTTASTTESTTAPTYNTTPVKIQFAGDVLLHESTAGRAQQSDGTYNFDKYFDVVDDYIDCDLGLVDIEGCVDYKGNNASLAYYPYFNVPNQIVPALKKIGFTTIITANNHAWDYGFDGMKGTVRTITSNGMEQLGDYFSQQEAQSTFIKEINGIKIGICAWTDSTNGNYMPDEYSAFCTKRFNSGKVEDAQRIVADVNALRQAGAEFVICCFHWGTEYQDLPTETQRQIAKAVIEGGADLIVGNHPHCIQPAQAFTVTRGGKQVKRYVFYACGNFIADQIILEKDALKTQQSVLGTLVIQRDGQTGQVEIKEIGYLPLLTHAYYYSGVKSTYKVLPIKQLVDNPIECAYASPGYFKSSYDRVVKLMGDDVKPD